MPPFIFSDSTQQPTDLSAENQWRSLTYLQYINGVAEDTYSWSLSFVQTCRFASTLPPAVSMFEGRVASLGIDRLGLDPAATTELLMAVAGEGVRMPGTPVKLRVARPWFALFETAASDEPWLPSNWLEGLELHGEPLSVWIGKRVPDDPICPNLLEPDSDSVLRARKQYADLDWSQYESTRFGWKLRDSPTLPPFFTPDNAMPQSSIESDWLQDTLEDVARRLRHDGEDLAWCAEQLEKIVVGLRVPTEFEGRSCPRPAAAPKSDRSPGMRLLAVVATGAGAAWLLQAFLRRRNAK